MSTTIPAHFNGEFFVPDAPVTSLRPGDRVEIVVLTESHVGSHVAPNAKDEPLLSLLDLAVDTGITDLAENADFYLYGHPKQSESVDAQ